MDLGAAHDPLEQIGDALRSARRRLRLSQRELAAQVGVDHALIGRWELGQGPAAVSRADGLLRMLGYRLVVVPCQEGVPHPGSDDPTPHVADRGLRRFPAHLEPEIGRDPTNDWLRYGWSRENPYGPDWTYRMDPVRREQLRERTAAAEPWPRSRGEAGLVEPPPPDPSPG